MELRYRLFQENHARDCQEIEELRRICCEESNRARQARIDELSLHQEKNPTTVSQLSTQFRIYRTNQIHCQMQENFYDPETASTSGATHVPSRPSAIPSPRTLPRCDSGLPHDTLNGTGITRNVFERPPAQEGQFSTLFNRRAPMRHQLQ